MSAPEVRLLRAGGFQLRAREGRDFGALERLNSFIFVKSF